jgi:hypothetical protein
MLGAHSLRIGSLGAASMDSSMSMCASTGVNSSKIHGYGFDHMYVLDVPEESVDTNED